MRTNGINADEYQSTEYCPDCDDDFPVTVHTDRITSETVTTYWECPEQHGHQGEIGA